MYTCCHLVSGLLLTKVPGHLLGQGAGTLDILWLIYRGPIFFFPDKNVISITMQFGDNKE